jgi:hypothetical protein
MSYFKFTNERNVFDDERIDTTTKEFDSEYLSDVVENFEMFLRGCGYHFNGHLDFVQDDESFVQDYESFNQIEEIDLARSYDPESLPKSSLFGDKITSFDSSEK